MTHTCQICGRTSLNLVGGVLEEHHAPVEQGGKLCHGPDRVREEGDDKVPAHDAIRGLAAALVNEQARSRSLREALAYGWERRKGLMEQERAIYRPGDNYDFWTYQIQKQESALAAYDTAAPLPPDAAENGAKLAAIEILDWIKSGSLDQYDEKLITELILRCFRAAVRAEQPSGDGK